MDYLRLVPIIMDKNRSSLTSITTACQNVLISPVRIISPTISYGEKCFVSPKYFYPTC